MRESEREREKCEDTFHTVVIYQRQIRYSFFCQWNEWRKQKEVEDCMLQYIRDRWLNKWQY